MLKPVKWSSYAEDDFAQLLEYLEIKWNKKVCLKFIDKLDFCIHLIQTKSISFFQYRTAN